MPAPTAQPAGTFVNVTALAWPHMMFEVEVHGGGCADSAPGEIPLLRLDRAPEILTSSAQIVASLGDERREILRRAGLRHRAELGEARLRFRRRQALIDRRVELADDRRRRAAAAPRTPDQAFST